MKRSTPHPDMVNGATEDATGYVKKGATEHEQPRLTVSRYQSPKP
jgi:hypothetical protein